MNKDLLYRIKNKWNREIAKRMAMLSNPYSYSCKEEIYSYQKEIIRRSTLPLTDIITLSQEIPEEWMMTLSFDMSESLFYGAFPALAHYAGLRDLFMPPKQIGVQHGYVFEICSWEKSKLELRNIVWSKKIVEMYHQHTSNPNIFAIGCPFFYADSILSEIELENEKKRLGKNLLAFPMHSQCNVDTNYDPNKFLSILENERKRFDTVRVCIYWKDVLRGGHKVFEDEGYEIVCNGHIFDPNFLRRQRSLFELADATISNGVGSHIGYSLFLNKPHWLIDDSYEYINTQRGGDAKDLTDVTQKDNFLRVKNSFLDNSNYDITQQQKDVVDEFWGISDMKTPSDLRSLLLYLYM